MAIPGGEQGKGPAQRGAGAWLGGEPASAAVVQCPSCDHRGCSGIASGTGCAEAAPRAPRGRWAQPSRRSAIHGACKRKSVPAPLSPLPVLLLVEEDQGGLRGGRVLLHGRLHTPAAQVRRVAGAQRKGRSHPAADTCPSPFPHPPSAAIAATHPLPAALCPSPCARSGQADEFMEEIPTVVVNPLPAELQQIAGVGCGGGRANACVPGCL